MIECMIDMQWQFDANNLWNVPKTQIIVKRRIAETIITIVFDLHGTQLMYDALTLGNHDF